MAERVLSQSRKNEVATNSEGIPILLPQYQSEAVIGMSSFYTIPIQPSAPTNAFSSGASIKFDIEPNDVTHIKQGYFRIKIKNSGSGQIQLAPAFELFDYVECRHSKGSGDILFRAYDVTWIMYSYLTQTENERKRQAFYGNYNIDCLPYECLDKIYHSDQNILQGGEEKYIHIPIPVNWWNMGFIHGETLASDLRFTFKCNTDIAISGDLSDLQLEEFDLIIDSNEEHSDDKKSRIAKQESYNHGHIFLDTIKLTYNNKTLTGQQKFYLNSIVNKVPFIVVAHKETTSPTGSGKYNFLEIGDDSNTYITLENSSGNDLIGNGTRPKPREWYRNFAEKTQSNAIKGLYVLDFTNELALKDAMMGTIDQFAILNGQKDAVVIQYGSSGTSEVHRVDLGVTASGGHFQIAYENEISEPILYNVSSDNLQNALRNMRCIGNKGYSPSVTGTPNVSSTIDISFDTNQDGTVNFEIGKPHVISNLVDGSGDPIRATTSIETYGKKGWSSGSDYTVDLYCFVYREVILDTQGNFIVRDL